MFLPWSYFENWTFFVGSNSNCFCIELTSLARVQLLLMSSLSNFLGSEYPISPIGAHFGCRAGLLSCHLIEVISKCVCTKREMAIVLCFSLFFFHLYLQDAFAHFKNFYSSFLVVALYELDVNLTFFLAKFLEKKRVLDVSFISSEVSLIWHLLCIFQTHVYFILGSNWSNKSSISLLRLFDGESLAESVTCNLISHKTDLGSTVREFLYLRSLFWFSLAIFSAI